MKKEKCIRGLSDFKMEDMMQQMRDLAIQHIVTNSMELVGHYSRGH
jgi:hypothetical protein